jgi:hypothetical protein
MGVRMKVRIVGVPPGEAPEWVREQWVGLVLPLADGEEGARSVRTWGVLTGPKTLPACLCRLFTGKYTRAYGFVVDAPRALEILAGHAPEAAQWWDTHTAYRQPGRKFVFPAEACQELGRKASGTFFAADRRGLEGRVGPVQRFCPTCGTVLSPEDIDTDRALATCWACNSLTSADQFGAQVVGTRAPPSPMRRNRQEIPRPRHFSVKEDGRSLRIRFRWIWRRFTKAASFCLFWNSGLVCWYWSALRTPEARIMWFAVIWGIPFVAIGLLLVYATLAGLLNRTVIKVTSDFLTVWQGPVPWWGNRRLRVDELERLYCHKDTTSVKDGGSPFFSVNRLYRN